MGDMNISKDWCINAARAEAAAGDPEVGVGGGFVRPKPLTVTERYSDEFFAKGGEFDSVFDALDAAVDIIAWMSGSNDFNPEGPAGKHWARIKPRWDAIRRKANSAL